MTAKRPIRERFGQLELPFAATPRRSSLPKIAFVRCVYCGSDAPTRDHVPPKSLLENRPWPLNLRTVPSCEACNSGWAADEQYFAVAIAQVGHHDHLQQKLEPGGSVYRALENSPGLDEDISRSLVPGEDGRVWFRPNLSRIGRIAAKIAFGLYCLKYGVGSRLSEFSICWISGPEQTMPQALVAAQWFWPGIRRKPWTRVQHGVFSYLFAEGWMAHDPSLYCFMNFHDTIQTAVACPYAVGRPRHRRLRAKPWSRSVHP